jgi:pimeloyl-ACP methyl ester carboxylesterase
METLLPTSARSSFVTCCGRELHVMEWGAPDRPPVVLWHGLARNARDFDALATNLAGDYRVIVPDTIGRGMSEWSPDPAREYCFAFYADLAQSLLDALGIQHFAWLGTSMGAALGIRIAAGPMAARLERLVLNDMSPEPNPAAMLRIKNYIGTPPTFDTVSKFEVYCREIYRPFGPHSEQQWRHMAMTSMRRLPDGRITTHYDPQIVRQLFDHADDFSQWPLYERIKVPVLLLRGESSDLVLPEHVAAMGQRRAPLQVVEIAGCGHAPALNVPDQIEHVRRFLAA